MSDCHVFSQCHWLFYVSWLGVTSWWIRGPQDSKPPSQTNYSSLQQTISSCNYSWRWILYFKITGGFGKNNMLLDVLTRLCFAGTPPASNQRPHLSKSEQGTDDITWKWCRSTRLSWSFCHHGYHETYQNQMLVFMNQISWTLSCLSIFSSPKVAAPWPLGCLIQVSKVGTWFNRRKASRVTFHHTVSHGANPATGGHGISHSISTWQVGHDKLVWGRFCAQFPTGFPNVAGITSRWASNFRLSMVRWEQHSFRVPSLSVKQCLN